MKHTPSDTTEITEKYLISNGGICGQSCIAVIERSSIQNVLENWEDMQMGFKRARIKAEAIKWVKDMKMDKYENNLWKAFFNITEEDLE